jgi:LuxR family transcriptional regulator, maltose regulon positive regulatory protein
MSVTAQSRSSLTLTKLQRPRVSRDLVHRSRLTDHLKIPAGLTLVIAPAGYGKTTLLSAWLETCDLPHAWLSLDAQDSDLIVFVTYLLRAVQTLFPTIGADTRELLEGVTRPPLSVISHSLLNDLAVIQQDFILVLDDYHVIGDSAVHELVTNLVQHPPQTLHLVMAARTEPPLPLSGLRARGDVAELRAADLRFTLEEAGRFLRDGMRLPVDDGAVAILRTRTEGWVAGLRLAALYYRHTSDLNALAAVPQVPNRYIMDYLTSQVLTRLPTAIQEFLIKTSILDRLCGPLCEAITGIDDSERDAWNGAAYLEWLQQADLFLAPLGERPEWFRYHHLFQQLLQQQLRQKFSPTEIAALHGRASAWLSANGYVEEALLQALAAQDTSSAVRLFTQQRRSLMDEERWHQLDRWLRLFPRAIIDEQPGLLLAEIWVLLNRHQVAAVPPILDRVEDLLARLRLDGVTADRLQGEVAVRRSTQYYYAADDARSLVAAQAALQKIPLEWHQLRAQARLFAGMGYLAAGDVAQAYATYYDVDELVSSKSYQVRLVANAGYVHWWAADLPGILRSPSRALALVDEPDQQLESFGTARYFVGLFHYQRNDLATAEQYLLPIVMQPYRAHAMVFLNSAVLQALIYQAQGQPDKAFEIATVLNSFALEARSANVLFAAQAFQAELALRQDRLAEAGEWAKQVEVKLAPMPWFYGPPMTLVRILLAQNTPDSRRRAGQVLEQLFDYVTTTHQIYRHIEGLALQALFYHAGYDEGKAAAALEQSIALAEPGGLIRVFVDLGAPLQRLLTVFTRDRPASPYAQEILAAFPVSSGAVSISASTDGLAARRQANAALLSPLTARELEVLALLDRRYTDQEIADTLVISLATVRSHIEHIGDKLGAHRRRAVVQAAKDQGLL